MSGWRNAGTGAARNDEVGIARDDNLFYVVGGYSVAQTRLDLVGNCFNPGNPSVPLIFNFSRSKTLSGFNIGAGVEHAIGSQLRVRAEYVYDDYGDQTYPGDAGGEWNARDISVHNSNLRFGLSYRF